VKNLKDIIAELPDAVFEIVIGFVAACTIGKNPKSCEPLTRALAAICGPDTITHQYAIFAARALLATGKPVLDDMPDELIADVVGDMRRVDEEGGSWWILRDDVDDDPEWLACLLQLSKHGNFVVTFSPEYVIVNRCSAKARKG
jgi:hypothetical protein